MFYYLVLHSYNYNIYVKGLLTASQIVFSYLINLEINVCTSEQCSQFERFHSQRIQIVNKTSSFKTKLIGNWCEQS